MQLSETVYWIRFSVEASEEVSAINYYYIYFDGNV